MAKQVRMIAPFEALRGNVSGKQNLRYPTKNNKAWEAPVGKRSYATNYTPRYICAQSAKTGKVYFALKRKSAVLNSDNSRAAMAAFGAASELYRVVSRDLSILSQLQIMYVMSAEYAAGISIESWFAKTANPAMRLKTMVKLVESKDGETESLTIKNPYIDSTYDWNFNTDILVKFWKQLAVNGITFTVDGKVGIAENDMNFQDIILDNEKWNVLGLTILSVSDVDYVKMGDQWLYKEGAGYVVASQNLEQGAVYFLKDDAPA